jgi:hypothetical protein
MPFPEGQNIYKSGGPAGRPLLQEALDNRRKITELPNPWLEGYTTEHGRKSSYKRWAAGITNYWITAP